MGLSREWFLYALQDTSAGLTTFNTTATDYYVAPALQSGVESGWEINEERELGPGRGRDNHELGALAPTGQVQSKFYVDPFLQLFLTFMRDTVKQDDTPGVGDYTYGMLYDDALDFLFFSAQQQYKDIEQFATSGLGLSVLAGIVNQWTLEASIKNPVKLTIDWLAKDHGISTDDSAGDSKTWHYGAGTANTPDLIDTTSITNVRPTARPLWFYDAAITYDSDNGGTVQFNPTTQISSYSSLDTLSYVNNVTLTGAHNIDGEGFELGSDRTREQFCPGNRDINIALDISWCDRSIVLYELAEAGAPIPFKLSFIRAADRYVDIYLPAVFLDPFKLPDVSGDKSKRNLTVNGRAEVTSVTNTTTGTTDMDINIAWASSKQITP